MTRFVRRHRLTSIISNMENYSLYKHTNKANGKVYIGITSQVPARRWANGQGYKEQRRFYSAILHYGWDSFEHVVLETGLSKDEAEKREAEVIREYKANDLRFGYNIENGGVIHKLSEEQKEHLRKVQLGRTHSEDTKRKMSEAHKGLSTKWLTGRKANESTKSKMSAQRKGALNNRARAVCQFDLNGNLIATYEYMELVKKALGINKTAHISSCCCGKRKTAYGYKWAYAED